jgi:hypothetical protein
MNLDFEFDNLSNVKYFSTLQIIPTIKWICQDKKKNPKEKKPKYGQSSSSCSLVLYHLNVLEVGTFLL